MLESRNMTSSTGTCLIFATSSATRDANQGPLSMPSNSRPYRHGPSLSTSSEPSGSRSTISRSRSWYTRSGVTETK